MGAFNNIFRFKEAKAGLDNSDPEVKAGTYKRMVVFLVIFFAVIGLGKLVVYIFAE